MTDRGMGVDGAVGLARQISEKEIEMYTTIGDIYINGQAQAVLALMKGDEIDSGDEGVSIRVETSAWYNCRETGYSIVTSKGFGCDSLVITFGEQRNSDTIFVDEWEMQKGINPPTVQDFTDVAYENRKWFNYGECGKAAHYIMDRILAYVNRVEAEA